MPGDLTPQIALERIAQKCLDLSHRRRFDTSNCTVREALLSADALSNLKLYHNRANPNRLDDTVVLLRYEGKMVVIDGNNRVNMWRNSHAAGPFRAIVIEPANDV